MTMQAHERIRFRGEECSLCATPLSAAFGSVIAKPEFRGFNTACRRGYIGEWEIRQDQLFLTHLDTRVWDFTDGVKPSAVGELFPGSPPDGVLANWCTDWLHLPMVEYMWIGFARSEPVTERDVFLAIHRGRLIAIHDIANIDDMLVTRELTPRLEEAYPAEAPFIRALYADWSDRLPRLVYADWLDERDDPRGQLLRVDVELSKKPNRSDLQARRLKVLEVVKDWFWMKLVGCDPPRDDRGWEKRVW